MSNTKGRIIEEWSEKQFVHERHQIWFGAEMPKTIAAKELIDNGLDQIADRKIKTDKVFIQLTRNTVAVIDNGNGISLERNTTNGKSNLYQAVHKLFTSTNYSGTDDITGNNGVGATSSNFLSEEFIAGHLKDGKITGYKFHEGEHHNDGDSEDIIDAPVDCPMFDTGFYVSADYSYDPMDEDINTAWLVEYTKNRVGELLKDTAEVVMVVSDDEINDYYKFTRKSEKIKEKYTEGGIQEENQVFGNWKEISYSKDPQSVDFIPSLQEYAEENNMEIRKNRSTGWTYMFAKELETTENKTHIVQGAPVSNQTYFNMRFEIGDFKVTMKVPLLYKYSGKKAPNYTDQTKVKVKIGNSAIESAFKKTPLYDHFRQLAEEKFLESQLKNNDSANYTPATGTGYKELIISEGYSASSGVKAVRDPKTQAVFFIIGVILNVYKKDLDGALKSPVVKELLTVLQKEKFDKIIFAVDADVHGSHICALLTLLIYKFQRSLLEEGRVYYLNSPFYIFKKGQEFIGSDNKDECPKGYHIKTNKGLGGLNKNEMRRFVTNRATRELWRFNIDEDANDSFYLMNGECGARWVIDKNKRDKARKRDLT